MKKLLFLLPSLLVVILIQNASRVFVGDDAYMTFSATKHFMEGYGLVANPGEQVISTTTPLWAMFIGTLCKLTGTLPHEIYHPINLSFLLANSTLLFLLCYRFTSSNILSGLSSMIFSLSSHNQYSALIGMETTFFVFVLLLISYLITFGKEDSIFRGVVGYLAGILFLIRPEGALGVVLVGVLPLVRLKKIPWPEIIGASLVILTWWTEAYLSYGTILPQSIEAKRYSFLGVPGMALYVMAYTAVEMFVPPGLAKDYAVAGGGFYFILMLSAICWFKLGSIQRHGFLALFSLFYVLAYTFGNPFMFDWYVVPYQPAICIGVVVGSSKLLELSTRYRNYISALLVVSILSFSFLRYHLGGEQSFLSIAYKPEDTKNYFRKELFGPKEREDKYLEIRHELGEKLNGAKVLAPEFGAIAYASEAHVISSIGHVNPEVTEFFKNNPEVKTGPDISVELIKHLDVDYIISIDKFLDAVLGDKWVNENYKIVSKKRSRIFDSEFIYAFEKINP